MERNNKMYRFLGFHALKIGVDSIQFDEVIFTPIDSIEYATGYKSLMDCLLPGFRVIPGTGLVGVFDSFFARCYCDSTPSNLLTVTVEILLRVSLGNDKVVTLICAIFRGMLQNYIVWLRGCGIIIAPVKIVQHQENLPRIRSYSTPYDRVRNEISLSRGIQYILVKTIDAILAPFPTFFLISVRQN